VDVDHRQLDRDAGDDRLRRRARLPAEHRRDVGAGAAHVERQHVLVAARAGHVRRADHPAGRPGEHAAGRLRRRRLDVDDPARGLHDQRRRHARILGGVRQPLEVGGELRAEVGVGDRGREALVLAELRQHLARERDVDVAQRLAHRLAHAALVVGVQEGEQQADGDGLHVRLAQLLDRLAQAVLVERLDLAVRPHALAYGEAEVARHERLGAALREVIEGGAVLARELDQVAEALGGDERRARTAALEQRVGRDRHPVREGLHVGGLDGFEAAHHPLRLILGGARHLRGHHPPAIERDEIGEGSSNIHTDSDHSRPFSTRTALARGFPSSGLVQSCTRDSALENTRCLRMQRVVER
jgi:hypothetical protein